MKKAEQETINPSRKQHEIKFQRYTLRSDTIVGN